MSIEAIHSADHLLNPTSASAEDILELALNFCLGRGVSQDIVAAHKWLNIAAMKGSKAALQYRHELAREMSASQVADALRQARAMLTLH